MKRLLLIVALALMSGACASAPSPYHAVSEGVLIPPVSITAPRPPAPEETVIVIDEVEVAWPPGMESEVTPRSPVAAPTSNNLKGKLNKGLAPYIKLDWGAGNKQVATAPVAVVKSPSAPSRTPKHSEQELKGQISNLLAQIHALQNSELKAVQAERDKALSDYILSKQETESLKRKITKVRSLKAMKYGGDMQWWVITEGHPEGWPDDLRREFLRWMSDLFFLIAIVFTFFLGRWRGNRKAESLSARVAHLKEVVEKKNTRITHLHQNHESEMRVRDGVISNLLQEEGRKDRRIAELKELVKHGFLSRNPEVDDPLKSVSTEPPDSVFGPLELSDQEEE